MLSFALLVALSSVPSSLARLDALKAEEKAIKKDLKAKVSSSRVRKHSSWFLWRTPMPHYMICRLRKEFLALSPKERVQWLRNLDSQS